MSSEVKRSCERYYIAKQITEILNVLRVQVCFFIVIDVYIYELLELFVSCLATLTNAAYFFGA